MAGAAPDSPLYKEVKRLLTETIQSGEWKPGTAIPSERQLSTRFHVAVGTLRKAVDELVQERILIRQQGRGTFVAAHNRDRMMFHFFHIQREDGDKPTPDVETLSFKAARADEDEAARLGIAAGDKVFRIQNVLRLAGDPVIFDRVTIPQSLFPSLTAAQFKNRPSTIYHLYQSVFGITVVRSAERLRAVRAEAEPAAILAVPKGAPLLEIRRVAMTFNDAPVEARISLVNTEHHEYFSDLAKA
ncbi:MAG: GntR family transcriptional regulator [Betaproteobacteria bacterium]|nr:GntR family transcriptional regulator [Betaproteobacteria bacterium]